MLNGCPYYGTTQEGQDFAKRHGCLFVETSAKAGSQVGQAFEELVRKILETPSLLNVGGVGGVRVGAGHADQSGQASCGC